MSSLNTTTTAIDDDSLAMLLDEVTAMAASGRSLTAGLSDIDHSAMGKIGRAARTVRTRMEQGQSASTAIASLSLTYQAPIRGAMQVMARTGSTLPLRETVRMIRDATERRRRLSLATINPILNVVVAATVAFFVIPFILVSLSEAELIKTAFSPTIIEICQTFLRDFLFTAAMVLLIIAGFSLMLHWWQRRAARYQDVAANEAIFCRWLGMQIGDLGYSHVDAGQAVRTAAEVIGPRFAAAWSPAVSNIRDGGQTAEALSMPEFSSTEVRQCVVDLVAARRRRDSIAKDLQRLSELYADQSRRRQAWWGETIPKWIAAIVMISVIVILVQAIVLPLFDVIDEVTS